MWCFDFAQYMKALVLRFPCNALTLSEKVACKALESSKKGLGNFSFLAWSSVQSLNLTLFNNMNLQQIFGSTTIFSLQMMKDNSWSLEVTQERVSIYPQRKVSWDLAFIAPVYACFLFYHSFTYFSWGLSWCEGTYSCRPPPYQEFSLFLSLGREKQSQLLLPWPINIVEIPE